MAVMRRKANIDVVTAARIRLRNIFSNGLPVYFSFSGGKDSLALGHLILDMIQKGEIAASQLTVIFIDEEAIYPCIERTVKEWRKKFLLAGAKFDWYAVEVRHFNCFNSLEENESFICWDREKEDVWIRRPPSFAIRNHPLLRPRIDTYQDFLARITAGGLQVLGVRGYESVQRLKNIGRRAAAGRNLSRGNIFLPIFDWRDNDVWLYLLEHKIEIPEVYLYLWQSGGSVRDLRVSQFFSVDTAKSLVKMNEFYPDLMERVIRREPNAYLAALYWDSEMFRRRTRKRRELEAERTDTEVDYKQKLIELFSDHERFDTPLKRRIANRYRRAFLVMHAVATQKDFRRMYEGLIAGDPKLRTLRGIYTQVFHGHAIRAKRKTASKGGNVPERLESSAENATLG